MKNWPVLLALAVTLAGSARAVTGGDDVINDGNLGTKPMRAYTNSFETLLAGFSIPEVHIIWMRNEVDAYLRHRAETGQPPLDRSYILGVLARVRCFDDTPPRAVEKSNSCKLP